MISAFACSSFWQLEDDQRDENEIEKKKKTRMGEEKEHIRQRKEGNW